MLVLHIAIFCNIPLFSFGEFFVFFIIPIMDIELALSAIWLCGVLCVPFDSEAFISITSHHSV